VFACVIFVTHASPISVPAFPCGYTTKPVSVIPSPFGLPIGAVRSKPKAHRFVAVGVIPARSGAPAAVPQPQPPHSNVV
jgi:hypothetical protein